jgi:indole-3-glycerol phosphate synthase
MKIMNILDRIIADKTKEVRVKKELLPAKQLEKFGLVHRATRSLKESLSNSPLGIIAEHKRRSPSRAVINQGCSVAAVISGYDKGGAAGISVLTDGKYFGGSLEDLILARGSTELPLLRKEFIIDPYQLLEARAFGADAILLIAAVLSQAALQSLCRQAQELGLEVLLEVHNMEELEASLEAGADMIGVNNRNLKTFDVDLDTSRKLLPYIPEAVGKVSESGLGKIEQLMELSGMGYDGFLIGESFMKEEDPGAALASFLKPPEK